MAEAELEILTKRIKVNSFIVLYMIDCIQFADDGTNLDIYRPIQDLHALKIM